MIGMVNIQCETPIDFYAAPPERLGGNCSSDDGPRSPTKSSGPPNRLLFFNHREHITYLPDGRKISDGVLLEKKEPNKLWQELLLRSFVARFEDEIKSPVDSYKTLETELAKLDVRDRSVHHSTYSLVSAERAEETKMKELQEEGYENGDATLGTCTRKGVMYASCGTHKKIYGAPLNRRRRSSITDLTTISFLKPTKKRSGSGNKAKQGNAGRL